LIWGKTRLIGGSSEKIAIPKSGKCWSQYRGGREYLADLKRLLGKKKEAEFGEKKKSGEWKKRWRGPKNSTRAGRFRKKSKGRLP